MRASRSSARPQSAPSTGEEGRHKAIFKVQRSLNADLRAFARGDGTEAAGMALQRHVNEAQGQFAAALEDTQAMMEAEKVAAAKADGAAGERQRHWTERLQFGHLGTSNAMLAEAEQLRRRHAAKRIQRVAKVFVARVRRERAVQRARERRDELARLRCETAATRIQAVQRGRSGRKEAAYARVDRAKRAQAARVIQSHHRRAGARRRRETAAEQEKAANRVRAKEWAKEHREAVEASERRREALTDAADAFRWAAARTIQAFVRGWLSRAEARRRQRAASVLSGAVRRWLVRRAHWWGGRVAAMAHRRRERERWREHRGLVLATRAFDAEAVRAVACVEAELARVRRESAAERDGFQQAWIAFETRQIRQEMNVPLPRGWIPQADPMSGKLYFLNTRTRELHTQHPGLKALRPKLAAERADKVKELEARLALLDAHAQHLSAGVANHARQLSLALQHARAAYRLSLRHNEQHFS